MGSFIFPFIVSRNFEFMKSPSKKCALECGAKVVLAKHKLRCAYETHKHEDSRKSIATRKSSVWSVHDAVDLIHSNGFQILNKDISYHDHEKLGEGNTAVVFKAEWKGRSCAAKMLKHGIEEGSTQHQDLISELSILTSVGSHNNLVTFYGACVQDLKAPIIIQELVEGPNLQTFIDSKRVGFDLGRSTVYRWTQDILSALNHLHDRNPIIMHRDLKPSNIVITRDLQTLKLADFGLAKLVSRDERTQMAHASNTGTLRYMAPEVFGHRDASADEGEFTVADGDDGVMYTEKADIYSAALIIWSLVTGMPPYIKIAENPTGRPNIVLARRRWPGIAGLLERMWEHAHERRPSAKECLAHLRSFACTGFRRGVAMACAAKAEKALLRLQAAVLRPALLPRRPALRDGGSDWGVSRDDMAVSDSSFDSSASIVSP